MAIRSVTGLNTTAIAMASGDTLIVTTLGTLFTEAGDALTGTGSVTMTVLGTIASSDSDAIDIDAGTVIDVNIGAAGYVGSNANNAVEIVADTFYLRNAGTVQGDSRAVEYFSTGVFDGNARIENSGTMSGQVYAALSPTLDGGDFRLLNSGVITGNTFADTIRVESASNTFITNTGEILSVTGIAIRVGAGSVELTNAGTIAGSVICGDGNDLLDTRFGTVTGTISGGNGNDDYIIGAAGARISEFLTSGTDRVFSTISYSLTDNVEMLFLEGADAIRGAGQFSDNQISGSIADNLLLGRGGDDFLSTSGEGNDTLRGGTGNDTLAIEDGDDCVLQGGDGSDLLSISGDASSTIDLTAGTLTGMGTHQLASIERVQAGSGNDTLFGAAGAETLDGGAGNDRVGGGGGADRLDGGAGTDTLVGGGQNDVFVFRFTTQSVPGAGQRDVITDFRPNGEVIDLALIDAVVGAGDNAFTFVGTATLSGGPGRLRYEQFVAENITIVEADTTGDGLADIQIELSGLHALTLANFVL